VNKTQNPENLERRPREVCKYVSFRWPPLEVAMPFLNLGILFLLKTIFVRRNE